MGDDPNFATTTATNIGTKVSKAGDTMTGNLSFGDNDRAIFGAGSDLQIYHDGGNSLIEEAGVGNLIIRGSGNVDIQPSGGGAYMARFAASGAASLYNNGAAKLATTSTGIDVTGTVTADGLTVDGNVGIGTSSPTDKLNISSGSNQIGLDTGNQATYGTLDLGHFTNGAFIGTQAGTNAASNLLRFGTSGTERMRIASSGNVGIGTSSPDALLHTSVSFGTSAIFGATNTGYGSSNEVIIVGGSDTNSGLQLKQNGVTNSAGALSYIYNQNNAAMLFGTNNTERMRIDSSGHLNLQSSAGSSTILYHGNSLSQATPTTNLSFGTRQNGGLLFFTNDTEAMRIDSNGNVGIGTSSPNRLLSLYATQPVFQITNVASGNTQGTIQYQASGSTQFNIDNQGSGSGGVIAFMQAGSERMRIDSSGNVGIGTSSPSAKLDVVGTVKATSFSGDGSSLTGISGTPAGAVIYHAGSTPPTGFIKANGASLSTTTYADLFAAIGYTYGGSGGSFNVPDLRGEFLRGWDDARGIDSGRGFGSFQNQDIQSHQHSMYLERNNCLGGSGGSDGWGVNGGRSGWSTNYTSSVGGTETRPRNVALLACIKY